MRQTDEHTLYEHLAHDLANAIRRQVYRVGERMPSIREISGRYRVSRSTVIQAYMRLEDEGLVYARPRAGHFVSEHALELPRLRPRSSEPVEVTVGRLSMELMGDAAVEGLKNFGAGFPSGDLLPLDKLAAITARVAHAQAELPAEYGALGGLPELRTQLARRAAAAGIGCGPEDVTVCNGGAEALTVAIRAVAKPGDVIAVESPTYFGVLQVIESLGMRSVEIATHPRGGMDLDALARVLRETPVKAVAAMPGLSNPLGCSMSEERKQALVRLLTDAEVPLIEDDVYGDLVFEHPRPRAAKAFDTEGNVIYLSSFSKTVAPGYRLGWIVAGRYTEQVQYLKFLATLTTASLPQLVVAELLRQGGYEKVTRYATGIYRNRLIKARQWVLEYFPPGTVTSTPAGGYFLWVALPPGVDGVELHQLAMQQRIRITPGVLFSPSNLYSNYIRISCAQVHGEAARAAIQRLGELVARLQGRVRVA